MFNRGYESIENDEDFPLYNPLKENIDWVEMENSSIDRAVYSLIRVEMRKQDGIPLFKTSTFRK